MHKFEVEVGGVMTQLQSAMQKYFSTKYRIVAMYPGTSN